jgi:hypothetical protein
MICMQSLADATGQRWTGTSLMWGAAMGPAAILGDLARHEGA